MTELEVFLLHNMKDVLRQRDDLKREKAIKRMWWATAEFRTVDGIFVGHKEICGYISRFLGAYPEFVFVATGEINEVEGAAHLPWTFGISGLKPAYTGADTVLVSNGRMQSVSRFLDGPVC